MKNKLLFILLSFWLTTNFSQQRPNVTINIRGKVIDKLSKQPLEYATIILTNKRTNKITGGITDSNGDFNITINRGPYEISVEFISFKAKKYTVQKLFKDKNLGIIALSEEENNLDEIIVVAEKSTVEIRLDKKIYNVGKDMTLRGGSASDVLTNIPSVDVDVEGNISLRGNESVRILIDGKPSAMVGINGADALKQLPADAIERVEVITSPSARYDAEGSAGILNIILRKGKVNGFNGSINISYGEPKLFQKSINLNVRNKKTNFFSNFGYKDRAGPGSYNSDITYLTDGNIDSLRTEDRSYNRARRGINGNLGLEYFIDKKSSVTGIIALRSSKGNNLSTNNISSFDIGNNNLYNFKRIQDENKKNNSIQFSLNYSKNFNKKGQKLNLDYQHSVSNQNEDADIFDIHPESNYTKDLSIRNLLQADFIYPIEKNIEIETGYRGNFRNLNSEYIVIAPNLDIRFNPSNDLDFSQKVNAFYTQFGHKINKFSYLLGLRGEATDMNVNLLNTNQKFNKRFFDIFPTLNVGLEVNDQQSFTLGYSKRIRRPGNRSLNPFENRASETIIYKGNIDLNPSYTKSYEIGYLNRLGKLTLNSSVYLQRSTDIITRVNKEDIRVLDGKETSVIIREPINLASENRIGFELTSNYNIDRNVRLSASFNYFKFNTKGEHKYNVTNPTTNETSVITQNFDAKNDTWFTRFDARVTLPFKINLQSRLFYRGPRKGAQSDVDGIFYTNLALSKDVLKNKGTISFNINDVLNSRKYVTSGYTPSRENSRNITHQSFQWRIRQFTLNFTYRFNQNKEQRNKRFIPNTEEENGGEF